MFLYSDSLVQDHAIKTRRLVLSGTARDGASGIKLDLAGNLYFATENSRVAVDAFDSGNGLANGVDATGKFGILLTGVGQNAKVLSVKASTFVVATGVVTAATVALAGASKTGISASGNIAFDVTMAGALSSTTQGLQVEIEFKLAE